MVTGYISLPAASVLPPEPGLINGVKCSVSSEKMPQSICFLYQYLCAGGDYTSGVCFCCGQRCECAGPLHFVILVGSWGTVSIFHAFIHLNISVHSWKDNGCYHLLLCVYFCDFFVFQWICSSQLFCTGLFLFQFVCLHSL